MIHVLKQLFFTLPHPTLYAQAIGIRTLVEWGFRHAMQTLIAFLGKICSTVSHPTMAQRYAREWRREQQQQR